MEAPSPAALMDMPASVAEPRFLSPSKLILSAARIALRRRLPTFEWYRQRGPACPEPRRFRCGATRDRCLAARTKRFRSGKGLRPWCEPIASASNWDWLIFTSRTKAAIRPGPTRIGSLRLPYRSHDCPEPASWQLRHRAMPAHPWPLMRQEPGSDVLS